MPINLPLQHDVLSQARPTDRTMEIAAMFGLSLDGTQRHTIIPPIQLPLAPGRIVFITGVSGGGKSTLLRLIRQAFSKDDLTPTEALEEDPCSTPPAVVCSESLPPLPDLALVDALAHPQAGPCLDAPVDPSAATRLPPISLEQVCHWLSLAGLNDAAVMLRKPEQLSEGQRHRLRLAQAMAIAERRPEHWALLLVDEFGSTLDRVTAVGLARSLRRWISQSRVCLIAATTHDDLLEALQPDVLVELSPGGGCEVHQRQSVTMS